MQMVLTFTNSSMPKAAHSRPSPDSFTPPKGSDGSDRTKSLTKHMPASISSTASFSPFSLSLVKTAPPKPKMLWFANSRICFSSWASMMEITGPKISSSNAVMPGVTSVSTVGAKNESPQSPSGTGESAPPASSLAPDDIVLETCSAMSCLALEWTSGPKSTPYFFWATLSSTFCSKATFTLLSTMTLFGDMQTCPVFARRAVTTASAATSKSASARMAYASDPPSSITDFFNRDPAFAATALPAPTEPVRATP
mmetsp:Transcript_74055/g.130898  ORF Transcript_74055/g.130898 Transcript_74055/m.130898 type:complete len:254 (-) Transcript_74055:700-1461(-)